MENTQCHYCDDQLNTATCYKFVNCDEEMREDHRYYCSEDCLYSERDDEDMENTYRQFNLDYCRAHGF